MTQWNDTIPLIGNDIGNDIPDIKENLEYLHELTENFFKSLSDTSAAIAKTNAYWADATEADQGVAGSGRSLQDLVTAIGATKNARIILAHAAAAANTTTYQFKRSLAIPVNIEVEVEAGAIIDTDQSIRSSTYKWTVSGSGTSEYYLELAAGGNPGIQQPAHIAIAGIRLATGTLGSLSASQWNWGDNDSLGYNTVYVRTSGSVDPDGLTADTVQAGWTVTINKLGQAPDLKWIQGYGKVVVPNSAFRANWCGTDSAAIQLAFHCLNGAGDDGTMIFSSGQSYTIDAKVDCLVQHRTSIIAWGATFAGTYDGIWFDLNSPADFTSVATAAATLKRECVWLGGYFCDTGAMSASIGIKAYMLRGFLVMGAYFEGFWKGVSFAGQSNYTVFRSHFTGGVYGVISDAPTYGANGYNTTIVSIEDNYFAGTSYTAFVKVAGRTPNLKIQKNTFAGLIATHIDIRDGGDELTDKLTYGVAINQNHFENGDENTKFIYMKDDKSKGWAGVEIKNNTIAIDADAAGSPGIIGMDLYRVKNAEIAGNVMSNGGGAGVSTPIFCQANSTCRDFSFGTNYLNRITYHILRSASYKWTISGSGTGEYYLQAAAGGDPGIKEPDRIRVNGTHFVPGTAGSLAASEWDWGDNDTLGYSTVYLRMSDDSDPDDLTIPDDEEPEIFSNNTVMGCYDDAYVSGGIIMEHVRFTVDEKLFDSVTHPSYNLTQDFSGADANATIHVMNVLGSHAPLDRPPRMVLVQMQARDSDSLAPGGANYVRLMKDNTTVDDGLWVDLAGKPNSTIVAQTGWVPCADDGTLYLDYTISDGGNLNIRISFLGYRM